MKHTIQCDIVSAQEEIFSGEATMVFATGSVGELGISPRHAPLITQLKPGPVRVQRPDGEEAFFFVGGGILEVMPHIVTVLADTAVRADDLDEAAAVGEDRGHPIPHRPRDVDVSVIVRKRAVLRRVRHELVQHETERHRDLG